MKSIKWISFCASNKALKTMLHFFPKALNTTTPYPVTCKLGLFGEGQNANTVLVDNVRLNQANGILLDTAFPALNGDYAGFIGLTVDISLRQQSVIFDYSNVIVELMSFTNSVMFYPTLIKEVDESKTSCKSFPVLSDTITETSLLIVNSTLLEFQVDILNIENQKVIENLKSTPLTAKEYSLEDVSSKWGNGSEFNSCWTNGKLVAFKFSNVIPQGVGVYVVCRDRVTKKITSCFNL